MKLFNKFVLHISPTPLVGAPEKISESLNRHTEYDSKVLLVNDYPGGLKGKFSKNVLMFNYNDTGFFTDLINSADIIHIHNFLDSKFLDYFTRAHTNKEAKLIYQIHSPLREGPIYFDFAKESGFDFDAKLSIAQYPFRIFQDYIPVPNIVTHNPSVNIIKADETPLIMFSPAHKRTGGRWNDKVSTVLDEALSSLEKLKLARVYYASGIDSYELFCRRRFSHISIDEIITGSFHQVSLEGLATGNVVINNADWFSSQHLQCVSNSEVPPPFVRANEDNIADTLIKLVTDKDSLAQKQLESYSYHVNNLTPAKLITRFSSIYNNL